MRAVIRLYRKINEKPHLYEFKANFNHEDELDIRQIVEDIEAFLEESSADYIENTGEATG